MVLPIPLVVVEAGGAAHRSGSTQEVGEGQLAGAASGKGQKRPRLSEVQMRRALILGGDVDTRSHGRQGAIQGHLTGD